MKHNQPYAVYTVDEGGAKPFWTRIGTAFPHKSGDGFNIVLAAFPVDGRLVVRKPKAQDEAEAGQ